MDSNFNGYDRIYHHHMMKCAGTTLNRFLELQVHHSQAQPHLDVGRVLEMQAKSLAFYPELENPKLSNNQAAWGNILHDMMYRHLFDHYQVVREHASLHEFVKGRVFKFTVLRDPAERVLSQLRDWQRLDKVHFNELEKGGRGNVRYAVELSPLEFMKRFLGTPDFPELDNFMVRSLAAVTLGQSFACDPYHPPTGMLNYAVRNLVHHFDLVFTQETFNAGFHYLCQRLGLCPQDELGLAGNTRSKASDTINIEPALLELLKERLAPDYAVYEVAVDMFQQYRESHPLQYGLREFEDQHANQRLNTLIPRREDDCVLYDIGQPVIGYGFWDRGSPGEEHCSIWTGPSNISGLYVPAPKGERVTLVVYINAFSQPELATKLKMQVDGRYREFSLHQHDDGRFILRIPHVAVRDFVHLRFELPQTFADQADPRPRGFLLWKYGWRSLPI